MTGQRRNMRLTISAVVRAFQTRVLAGISFFLVSVHCMAVRQDRLMPHISKNKLALGGVKWFLASQAQRKVYVGQ